MTDNALTKKTTMNQDTGFLKTVAIICMVLDHIGKAFFPSAIFLQIIGRIAFPIFAFCIVIGCLYTHDIKKYLLRLFIFAVIAQPFFALVFYKSIFKIYHLNTLFTLFFGAVSVYGLMDFIKRWWMLILCAAACVFLDFDYGTYGIVLIIAFYAFRENRLISAVVIAVILAIPFYDAPYVLIGGVNLGVQGFAVLSMPFIYIRTGINIRINKYFFYVFYPAHIFVIFVIGKLLK